MQPRKRVGRWSAVVLPSLFAITLALSEQAPGQPESLAQATTTTPLWALKMKESVETTNMNLPLFPRSDPTCTYNTLGSSNAVGASGVSAGTNSIVACQAVTAPSGRLHASASSQAFTSSSSSSSTRPSRNILSTGTTAFGSIATGYTEVGIISSRPFGSLAASGTSFQWKNSTTVTHGLAGSGTGVHTVPSGLVLSTKVSGVVIGGSAVPIPSSTETIIEADGLTVEIAPSDIVESGQTIPYPSVPTTLTTNGLTLTFDEGASATGGLTVPGFTGTNTGSATSATGSPAITPPASGSPGSIPDTVPASGVLESAMAVTFEGDTYVLPHTVSVNLLQRDGATVTLFSDLVVSGTATVSVPPSSSQTILHSGGFSVEAGPEPKHKPSTDGLIGLAALIHILEDLAGTANSVVNKLDRIGEEGTSWASGAVSDSAFASAVGSLFDSASSDLSSLASSMSATLDDFGSEIYEMTEDGQRRIFPARTGTVEELDLLRSLRKLTRNLTGLRNDVILTVKDYWKQGTAAAAALAAAEEALRNFGSYKWGGELPQSSSSTSTTSTSSTVTAGAEKKSRTSSTSSPSSTATPVSFFFSTKEGTDVSTFKKYIGTLPDGGEGIQTVFPDLPWQSYTTNLTFDQADEVASQMFIDFIGPCTVSDTDGFDINFVPEQGNQKRTPSNKNLDERLHNDDPHLRILSDKVTRLTGQLNNILNRDRDPYLYDPLLGRGQTIYIIDSGYRADHIEFSNTNQRTVTSYYVGNALTMLGSTATPASDDITDHTGHGTMVGSIAGGKDHGVASKANLVFVKFRQSIINGPTGHIVNRGVTDPALDRAWQWVMQDVTRKRIRGNQGKFIINMSGGFEYLAKDPPAGASRFANNKVAIMRQRLNQAWARDIITVIAAGNEGMGHVSLDERVPQLIGTADNGLITVGSATSKGVLDLKTTFDAGKGGSISLYGVGDSVPAAGTSSNTAVMDGDGTSVAAPVVAGLAAYFASLPSLNGKWRAKHVATDMKSYIIDHARARTLAAIPRNIPTWYSPRPNARDIKFAYNLAPDDLCSITAVDKRADDISGSQNLAKRQESSEDFPVVVNGRIMVSNLTQVYCPIENTTMFSSSSTTFGTSVSIPSVLSSSSNTASAKFSTSGTQPASTTASFMPCTFQGANPDAGVSAYCECSSSTFPVLTASSGNECAYTVLPTSAAVITASAIATTTSNCQVCTDFGEASRTCTTLSGCTASSTTTVAPSTTAPPPATSSPPTTLTTSTTAPAAPTVNIDSGILTCGTAYTCPQADSGSGCFELSEMNAARDDFCGLITTSATSFGPKGDKTSYFHTYVDPNDACISIAVTASYGALDESTCPETDFSGDDTNAMYDLCQARLNVPINDCDTQDNDGLAYWKQGGTFFRDCITWNITWSGSNDVCTLD